MMFYYGSGAAAPVCDYNDIYVNSSNGNNYTGYFNNSYTTFTNWQTSGYDSHGTGANPTFSNSTIGNLTPTNLAMDNLGQPLGLFVDYYGNLRNQTTPDMGAVEFNRPNCTGTPTLSGVASPTYAICAGETVTLGLSNYIAQNGFTYWWSSSSSSSVGPFTNTVGTSFTIAIPSVTTTTYYQLVMTCTLPGG